MLCMEYRDIYHIAWSLYLLSPFSYFSYISTSSPFAHHQLLGLPEVSPVFKARSNEDLSS